MSTRSWGFVGAMGGTHLARQVEKVRFREGLQPARGLQAGQPCVFPANARSRVPRLVPLSGALRHSSPVCLSPSRELEAEEGALSGQSRLADQDYPRSQA